MIALQGSYSGVVGLPLYETANLLAGLGYRCHERAPDSTSTADLARPAAW